jgi:hypothetical protein
MNMYLVTLIQEVDSQFISKVSEKYVTLAASEQEAKEKVLADSPIRPTLVYINKLHCDNPLLVDRHSS